MLGSLVATRRRWCDSSFTTSRAAGSGSPRAAYCSPARHRLKTKEAALLPQRAILQRLLIRYCCSGKRHDPPPSQRREFCHFSPLEQR